MIPDAFSLLQGLKAGSSNKLNIYYIPVRPCRTFNNTNVTCVLLEHINLRRQVTSQANVTGRYKLIERRLLIKQPIYAYGLIVVPK